MSNFYSVILTDPVLPPFMTLARALARAHKTPELDQVLPAKRAWGILAENQSESVAQALQQGLYVAGLNSRMVEETRMATLPPEKLLTKMESIPAERIALLGVAAVPEETTTTTQVKEGPSAAQSLINTTVLMSTGIPLKLGGKTRVTEKTTTHTDRLFYFDIVLRDPGQRFRIDAAHFDYSCLKDKKVYQSFGNFKLVIEDLVAQAPNASLNHGIRILQEKKPQLEMEYASLSDFERELRWRLTLKSFV